MVGKELNYFVEMKRKMESKIYLITCPRSGHHLIVDLIAAFASFYNLPFSYCEFYCHNLKRNVLNIKDPPVKCTNKPCVYDSMLMKSHDFALNPNCAIKEWKTEVPIQPASKYIVIYRKDPVIQLEAWYRHYRAFLIGEENYDPSSETYDDFISSFFIPNIEYINAFYKKWVFSSYDNCYKFYYEDIIESPRSSLIDILHVVYPQYEKLIQNDVVIDQIIQSHNVAFKHKIPSETHIKLKTAIQQTIVDYSCQGQQLCSDDCSELFR